MNEPILVWRFADAPEEFRALSEHGGDEDWVAVVPVALRHAWIPWLEFGPFGVCDISEHLLADGRKVCIGAHS